MVDVVTRAARKKCAKLPEVETTFAEPERAVLLAHLLEANGTVAIFERLEDCVFQGGVASDPKDDFLKFERRILQPAGADEPPFLLVAPGTGLAKQDRFVDPTARSGIHRLP